MLTKDRSDNNTLQPCCAYQARLDCVDKGRNGAITLWEMESDKAAAMHVRVVATAVSKSRAGLPHLATIVPGPSEVGVALDWRG